VKCTESSESSRPCMESSESSRPCMESSESSRPGSEVYRVVQSRHWSRLVICEVSVQLFQCL